MLDSKLMEVFKALSNVRHTTAQDIATMIGVSEKTVRNRIKTLNVFLNKYAIQIKAKRSYGYILSIQDEGKYEQFLQLASQDILPNTNEDRVTYLLHRLISNTDYIKLDDLSDELYVSKPSITANLKEVERIITPHHLWLERRPNFGVRLCGKEFDKRICFLKVLDDEKYLSTEKLQQISELVIQINQQFNVKMSEVTFDFFIKYISLAIERIEQDYHTADYQINLDLLTQATLTIVDKILLELSSLFNVQFNEAEKHYLSMFYGASLSSDSYSDFGPNFVITSQINEIVFKMLDSVKRTLGFEFKDNLELLMSLNQHMVPMDIRLRYNIGIVNPLLEQVKQEYSLAYTVAVNAVLPLRDYYKNPISEDEIGFIAIIFALALEKSQRNFERKNIIIVCASGKGTAQLFSYRYKKAFAKHLNTVYECSPSELSEFDYKGKNIHYVFTTVALNEKVPVPVCDIDLFFDDYDVVEYQSLFEIDDYQFLEKYFPEKLFISGENPYIVGVNKEEVLEQMVAYFRHYLDIPDTFFEAVMAREMLGQTEFGSNIAMPHPNRLLTEHTFAMIYVSDKPINWGIRTVQVIILFSVGVDYNHDIEKFYDLVSNFIFDTQRIEELIKEPTYQNFLQILSMNKSNIGEDEG